MSEKKIPPKDAGRRSLDHYKRRLPPWRLAIRDFLLPIVRYETPVLARLQKTFRSPALDTYFALTANFGTHTFYMIFLPLLFWSGYNQLFRAMINLLASGVFFTGVFKDLVCLPRPLSPPLQRISTSSSAPLEYGTPSTHSANAASVLVYGLYLINQSPQGETIDFLLKCLLYYFVTTIIVGRLYCGMHGFFDCITGCVLGAILAVLQCLYGDAFDNWIWYGTFKNVAIVTLLILFLVRIHPEPADDCPCFDDSVAFSGVIIGVTLSGWHFQRSGFATQDPVVSTAPYSLQELGYIISAVRIICGVACVLLWRTIAKKTLLKGLPPLFRVLENMGVSLPRNYFLKASEYGSVPPLRKDDNIIPRASDIPEMLDNLRHPRRRTVSVGPQSEADAYEMMAVRERRRRGSRTIPETSVDDAVPAYAENRRTTERPAKDTNTVLVREDSKQDSEPPTQFPPFEDPETTPLQRLPSTHDEDEEDDQALFAKLQVPRVRYDVEVVTKLVVYAGIGCIAAEGGPILFELCGLGMGVRP